MSESKPVDVRLPKYPQADEYTRGLENRFTYHAPFGDQAERYVMLRKGALHLARMIFQETPFSREQSLALTKLEECVHWANAGIARNEKEGEEHVEEGGC